MNKTLHLLFALLATVAASAQTTGTGSARATIGGEDTDIQWVQLWENGPKWAVQNVGATSPVENGSYFNWSSANAAPWGENWELPTKQNYDDLLENCDSRWLDIVEEGTKIVGIQFRGKEGSPYAENTLFIPAAGYNNGASQVGSNANYWTSTEGENAGTYYYFGSSKTEHGIYGPIGASYTLSARLVLRQSPAVTLNTKGFATYSSNLDVVINTPGVKAYKVDVVDDSMLLTELDGYIPSSTGALLYGKDMAGTSVDFVAPKTSDTPADQNYNMLIATTTKQSEVVSKPEGLTVWALGTEDWWGRYTGTTFKANRAFFVYDNAPSARMQMSFGTEEETTGISQLTVDSGQFFDKRSVASAERTVNGKYIENGRLIINKDGRKYNVNGQEVR